MKKTYLLLISLFAFSSCTTTGGQHCLNNGYQKDTIGYKQCTAKYNVNSEFYKFCKNNKGLISEGPNLDQCVQNSRSLKNDFNQTKSFCKQESQRKFSDLFSTAQQEKQPTLNENGDLIVGDVILAKSHTNSQIKSYTKPYQNECLKAHGWNNPNNWKGEKRYTSINQTTNILTQLNQQPIKIITPEHITVRLFSAAAEGNIYIVEQLLDSSQGDVSTSNHQGYNVLHIAARRGHYHIVQLLLEKYNANMDIFSHKGENAISLASIGNHHGIIHLITNVKIQREREKLIIQEQIKETQTN